MTKEHTDQSESVTRRVRRSQAERRAQTRADVLAAAYAVFVRRGFGAASVDEIAEEAGYSKGALYYNFAGKEELFLALVEQRLDERAAGLDAARAAALAAGSQPEGAWLARAVEALPLDRDWTVLFFEFACHAARHPEVADAFRERLGALRELAARALADLAAAGGEELPAPADRLATALSALANGMAVEVLVGGDEADAHALLAESAARLVR